MLLCICHLCICVPASRHAQKIWGEGCMRSLQFSELICAYVSMLAWPCGGDMGNSDKAYMTMGCPHSAFLLLINVIP